MLSDQELQHRFRAAVPQELVRLAERLREAGHAAYVVGGSIRDLILGRAVEDWDVASDARPDEVSACFDRTTLLHTGHGTTQVRLGGHRFEVTTFRVDGPYSDGRHPDSVRFVSDLETDLRRRDFTVNAIALDPLTGEIIDPHEGRRDMESRLIRTVGDPAARFREDSLRVLRAARFAAALEFEIDSPTLEAMKAEARGLDRIAPERIHDEILRTLAACRPSTAFRILQECAILERFLPELSAAAGVTQNVFHAHDVFTHSLKACDAAPVGKPLVRLAALLHDVGKVPTRSEREGRITFYGHERIGAAMVERRLQELRFPRREIDSVVHLVAQHMFHYERDWSDAAVRRLVARVGVESLDDLFDLRAADVSAKGPGETEPEYLDELRARIEDEIEKQRVFSISDLAVDGRDLMRELGLEEGPAVGRLLRRLLEHVIDSGGPNERHALLERARELMREKGAT